MYAFIEVPSAAASKFVAVSDLAVELEMVERAPTPLGDRLPQTVCDVIDRYRHQQPLPV
jgi:hypothetical protein